jgi:hypothetical protein
MAQATSNKPLCVRYAAPFITKDGRIIPSKVTEVGTFGEPGWSWDIRDDGAVHGPL